MDLIARLTLQDDLSGRMRKVTSSLTDVEKRTKSATTGFSNMGTSLAKLGAAVGITALLAKGVGMIKSSIGSAFDRIDTMERFERTMTTMLGSSTEAKKALEGINEAVTGTAYGLDAGAMAVQNFVSRGIEVTKATKWFETMGDAVAFYGDGSNEQLESVTAAMAKMATSGKVNMQQMETMTNAGIDAMGMYGQATGKTTDQVKKALSSGSLDAEEFFDVVTTAMNEGTNGVQKIAGSAKDAGATWSGAIANMKFAVVRGVQAIIMTIDEMLEENGLPSMRDMVSSFGKAFEKSLKGATKVISPLVKGIAGIVKVVKPLIPVLMTIGAVMGVALAGALILAGAIKIMAVAVAFITSPIGLVILALTAIGIGFHQAYKKSEPFRDAIDRVVASVKALFKIFNGEHKAAIDILEAAGLNEDQINKVRKFGYDLKESFDRVKDVLSGIGTMISGGGSADLVKALGFSPETVGKITEFIQSVKDSAIAFVGFLKEKWADLQPGIESLLNALTTAKDFVLSVFDSLLSFLGPLISGIGTWFTILADIAVLAFNNVIAPAIEFVMSMFKLLWKVVGPLLVLLGEAIKVAFNIMKVVWDTIIKPVAEYLLGTFKEAFEASKPHIEALGTAFDKIGGLIEWATDKLKSFSGWLKDIKIPDWVNNVGGKIAGAAEWVGGLAGGSASQSNYHGNDRIPYDGYLARLHRGERILTRNEADEMDNISYEGVTGGSTYNNQTYNNVSTTQAPSTKQSVGGGGITFTGNTFHVRQESDIDDIADRLYHKINAALEGGA